MYYNTNRLDGDELAQAILRNVAQRQIIEAFFKTWPLRKHHVYSLQAALINHGCFMKESSMRRALNELKDEGVIVDTGEAYCKYAHSPNAIYKLTR